MPSLQTQAEAIAAAYLPPDRGRPSDIGSAPTVQQFLEAVGDGNYIETAAKLSGLSKVTVYEWLKRGATGEEPFKSFANALEKAEARAEAHMVANVRKASELPQFWAAGMTVLERRHPDRWGKRQDEGNAPKVVVNIGVGAGDVKVGIINSAFAPPTSSDSLCITEPSAHLESNNKELCYLTEPAQSSAPAEAIGDPLRADPKGTLPQPPAGVGVPRKFFSGKGKSAVVRRQRKKRVVRGVSPT